MGCCSSQNPAPKKETPNKGEEKTILAMPGKEEPKMVAKVQVYGTTVSMNCMGTIMLATQERLGNVVPTMPSYTDGEGTRHPDFLKINPFHGVPAIKDGDDLCLGESNSVLRYLSGKYVQKLYLDLAKQRRAHIDWAMDKFASTLYLDVLTCIYPLLGFASAPDNQEEAGKKATAGLEKYADVFLQDKFIGGKEISIADYKVAPFFFLYAHPKVKDISKVVVPQRILQFNYDFKAACPEGAKVLVDGENSLKGYLDNKTANEEAMIEVKQGFQEASVIQETAEAVYDFLSNLVTGGKGDVTIYGVAMSMNAMGPVLLQQHADIGNMEVCLPGTDSQTDEYKANFPYGGVPGMKDGKWYMSESNAILRYMAREYAEELYPADPAMRAHIDWALDRFTFAMYNDAVATIYVAMGFSDAGEEWELKVAGEKAKKGLEEFCDFFLKDRKFVGGDKLSIADFKVAPFFYAYTHPRVLAKCQMEAPPRIVQFNQDFLEACPKGKLLYPAADGSIGAHLDSKDAAENDEGDASPTTKEEKAMQGAMELEAQKKVVDAHDHGPTIDNIDNTSNGCGCSLFGIS